MSDKPTYEELELALEDACIDLEYYLKAVYVDHPANREKRLPRGVLKRQFLEAAKKDLGPKAGER